jgi:SUMO ligase MMS21 Smc5/6 complex component
VKKRHAWVRVISGNITEEELHLNVICDISCNPIHNTIRKRKINKAYEWKMKRNTEGLTASYIN